MQLNKVFSFLSSRTHPGSSIRYICLDLPFCLAKIARNSLLFHSYILFFIENKSIVQNVNGAVHTFKLLIKCWRYGSFVRFMFNQTMNMKPGGFEGPNRKHQKCNDAIFFYCKRIFISLTKLSHSLSFIQCVLDSQSTIDGYKR